MSGWDPNMATWSLGCLLSFGGIRVLRLLLEFESRWACNPSAPSVERSAKPDSTTRGFEPSLPWHCVKLLIICRKCQCFRWLGYSFSMRIWQRKIYITVQVSYSRGLGLEGSSQKYFVPKVRFDGNSAETVTSVNSKASLINTQSRQSVSWPFRVFPSLWLLPPDSPTPSSPVSSAMFIYRSHQNDSNQN